MKRERVRVVLDDSVTEADLTALASDHGWWNKSRIGREGNQPEEYIYSTRDGETDIHFIQDHRIGVTYLLVKGPETSKVVQILVDNLQHYDPDDIRAGAKNEMTPAARQNSLYFLALITMDHGLDPEVFAIYKRALADPDPIVRGSAVLGSAYLGWPQLAEPLRALAALSEPDERIRNDAALLSKRLAALPTQAR